MSIVLIVWLRSVLSKARKHGKREAAVGKETICYAITCGM